MKIMLIKVCLVCLLIVSLNGCAFSIAKTEESMGMSEASKELISPAQEIHIGCGVKMYSFMPSVVIPLPPLIPFPNSSSPTLQIITHKKTIPRVFMSNPTTKERKHRIYYDFERIHTKNKATKIWSFSLPRSCASLDKKQIMVEYRNSKHDPAYSHEIYDLHYSNNGLELEWEYFTNN